MMKGLKQKTGEVQIPYECEISTITPKKYEIDATVSQFISNFEQSCRQMLKSIQVDDHSASYMDSHIENAVNYGMVRAEYGHLQHKSSVRQIRNRIATEIKDFEASLEYTKKCIAQIEAEGGER